MEFNKISPLEEYENDNKKSEIHTSNISTDSESSGPELNHGEVFFSEEDSSISSTDSSFIMEVDDSNLEEALKEIKTTSKKYNYIGMDTEFPGTVYSLDNITKDFYYQSMKKNVDSLKLIQIGMTFTDKEGKFPTKYKHHTYQFNFKFDEEKDNFSEESINLLKNNGINFKKLKKNGIKAEKFAEKLISSGLVLNPKFHWISYHGSHDFAYLLKSLIKDKLPESEEEFMNLLKMYFPNFYDVRMMIKDDENLFHGGLNKLIANLKIKRKGINHQAGSDAIATVEAFHKLKENGDINDEKIKTYRNVLYGLGLGEDNENTIKYINKNSFKNRKINIENKTIYKPSNNMMNINQNYGYNNMIIRTNTINPIIYMQQIQKQKQIINNLMMNNNMNKCLQYAMINQYQRMQSCILLNKNMKLIKTNA